MQLQKPCKLGVIGRLRSSTTRFRGNLSRNDWVQLGGWWVRASGALWLVLDGIELPSVRQWMHCCMQEFGMSTASICHLHAITCHLISRWGSCSASCGNGSRTREISCSSGKHVFNMLCTGIRCLFFYYTAVSKDATKKCKMSIRCSEATTKS